MAHSLLHPAHVGGLHAGTITGLLAVIRYLFLWQRTQASPPVQGILLLELSAVANWIAVLRRRRRHKEQRTPGVLPRLFQTLRTGSDRNEAAANVSAIESKTTKQTRSTTATSTSLRFLRPDNASIRNDRDGVF